MDTTNSFTLLSENIQNRLNKLNITTPTQVQNKIIPEILDNKNVIFQSETGTGKTFAYLLPLIEKLEKDEDKIKLRILVLAPTFELASQINLAVKSITDRKSALIIGGSPLKRQIETLKEKPQIIVGTCARIAELIHLKKIKINDLTATIFDETDRLVKKESFDDTEHIRELIPKEAQIIACSATLNKQTKIFFAGIENVVMPTENILKNNITHWAILAEQRDKIETLRKFIVAENPEKALIFTSRADQVENIYSKLTFKKISCLCLHSKEDKKDRKAAIDKFRSGKISILITSDLAARGLDIQNITHVIQMDLPSDDDFFIHRSGRTARAGKKGINVVIGDEHEMRHFAQLEKQLGITVYPRMIYDGKISDPNILNEKE